MEYKYKVVNKLTCDCTFLYDRDEVDAYIGKSRSDYIVINLAEDLTEGNFVVCRKTWKRKDILTEPTLF